MKARAAGALGVLATLCIIPSASADPGVSAPPGTSEATAVSVGDTAWVSHSKAEAGPGGGKAEAGVVYLNGDPVLGTGGSQNGKGHSGGSLLDTGATPLGRLAVAPWDASVDDDGTTRSAHGRSSVLDAYLIDEDTLTVSVLTSESSATHTDEKSTGESSTDGAHVTALKGAVDVTVLHAEASSEHGGSSYLLKVNGTEVGTDEQLGSACQLGVPNVANVGCLAAGGGTGSDGVKSDSSSVATADVVPVPDANTTLFGTKTTSGTGTPAEAPPVENNTENRTSHPATPQSPSTGALPMTGSPLLALSAIASALLAAGSWVGTVLRGRNATA